jgi:hypothetical protein
VDMIEATRKNCDFCSLSVASDPLKTLSDKYEPFFENDERFLVADGAFKHQDYNALFIAKKHNPLSLDLEDYKALFKTADKWFEAVIKGMYFCNLHTYENKIIKLFTL